LCWSAAAVCITAVSLLTWLTDRRLRVGQLFGILFGLSVLIALSAAGRDTGNWRAFHVLLAGHAVVAYLLLATGLIVERFRPEWLRHFVNGFLTTADAGSGANIVEPTAGSLHSDFRMLAVWRFLVSRWTLVAVTIAVGVSVRALLGDPQSPWWTIGVGVAMTPVIVAVACWTLRPALLYAAAGLIQFAGSMAFVHLRGLGAPESLIELLYVNVGLLALPAPLWMTIHRRLFLRRVPATARRTLPVHRAAAMFALAALLLLVGYGISNDVESHPLLTAPVFHWLTLLATASAIGALLWDDAVNDSVFALYVLGLAAAGMALDQLDFIPRWLWWNGTLALAAYTLLTSFLWSRRRGLSEGAARLRISISGDDFAGLQWLVPANLAAAFAVMGSAILIDLSFPEFPLRIAVAKAAAVQALSIGLVARGARRTPLQFTALVVGVIGAVAIGWSALDPATTGTLLNRAVVLLAAVTLMTVLYGFGSSKFLSAENEWTRAAQRLVPALLGTAAIVLAVILIDEVGETLLFGEVAVAWPAILLVAVTLVGLAVAALVAAVLPGRDPFGLSERGRQAYVYGAEIILGLLFLHVRLTMPWLFHGFFEQYWPLVVMLIAFLGAGIGEVLRRRQIIVVGEPLEQTGALLPLLPALGYWALPTRVDYGLLLLSAAVLYGALSAARRSFVLALIAVLAANGALWHFLHHQEGYRLLEHPQLWLIPPALSVLVAAYVNRRQLPASQLTAIRYAASTMIYVSSTADIFINGVAQNAWLPLVLAALSLLGIFAGILLQVRAFLFMGTSFLLVALLTIIWHAAVDLQQTWLWAASGVVTGVLIIAVFAVFEKKRQEVLEMLDRLKQWDA
jgi:hypothetical protein